MTDNEMRNLQRAAAMGDTVAEARLATHAARIVGTEVKLTGTIRDIAAVEIEGRLKDVAAIERFALAGNAKITLQNLSTKARHTYRLRRPRAKVEGQSEHARPIYVDLLVGSDNMANYAPLGVIRTSETERPTYSTSRVSTIDPSTPAAKGMAWLMGHVIERKELPSVMVAHHEGTCGKCGRALTVPASIESGIGPECARGKKRVARTKRLAEVL